jgi:mono/diheme cytochrome c family protein
MAGCEIHRLGEGTENESAIFHFRGSLSLREDSTYDSGMATIVGSIVGIRDSVNRIQRGRVLGSGKTGRRTGALGVFVWVLSGMWSPVFADDGAAAGKAIYMEHCSMCHGERGDGKVSVRGRGGPPPDFTDPAFWNGKTDSFLVHVIVNGLGAMPPWEETLSPRDVEEVLSYIKTFRK